MICLDFVGHGPLWRWASVALAHLPRTAAARPSAPDAAPRRALRQPAPTPRGRGGGWHRRAGRRWAHRWRVWVLEPSAHRPVVEVG